MKIRKIGDRSPTPNQRIAMRDPCDRRYRAQHLEDRVQRAKRAADPTHPEAERNRDQKRQPEAGADAEQRGFDVLRQGAVLREFPRPGARLATASERSRCRSSRRRSTRPRSGAGSRGSAARSLSAWRQLRSPARLNDYATGAIERVAIARSSVCASASAASPTRAPESVPRSPSSCPLACAVHIKL